MSFVILGSRNGEQFRAARLQPESAIVLAMRLADEGYEDVAIVDRDGAQLSALEFRRRHIQDRPGPDRDPRR